MSRPAPVPARVEENGKVAYMHRSPLATTAGVSRKVDGKPVSYAFELRNHVALAWIAPEDENDIRGITKTCCGGHKRAVFILANLNQVQIWKGEFRR